MLPDPLHNAHPVGIALAAPDHKTITPDGTAPAKVTYPAPLVMLALSKVIFDVPSKLAPAIVRAVSNEEAVAALPEVF